MASTDDLRRNLGAAQEELDEAIRALAPKHKGGEWARYRAATARCYELERALGKALGDEYAVRIEWPHPWDTGAPVPRVLSSGPVVLLLYLMADTDADWDGTWVTVVDPVGTAPQELAIVRFERCATYKFAPPDEDTFLRHPLHNKGLEPYAAHVVENSSWIVEHETINSTLSRSMPGVSPNYKHYLLLFHDEIFECIATRHAIDRFRGTFAAALTHCETQLGEGVSEIPAERGSPPTQYYVARPIVRPAGTVEPAKRGESPVPSSEESELPSGTSLPLSWFMVLGMVAAVIFAVRGCG